MKSKDTTKVESHPHTLVGPKTVFVEISKDTLIETFGIDLFYMMQNYVLDHDGSLYPLKSITLEGKILEKSK